MAQTVTGPVAVAGCHFRVHLGDGAVFLGAFHFHVLFGHLLESFLFSALSCAAEQGDNSGGSSLLLDAHEGYKASGRDPAMLTHMKIVDSESDSSGSASAAACPVFTTSLGADSGLEQAGVTLGSASPWSYRAEETVGSGGVKKTRVPGWIHDPKVRSAADATTYGTRNSVLMLKFSINGEGATATSS